MLGALGVAGFLEPLVGVAGVVHHHVGDDPDAPAVGGLDQLGDVVHVTELRQHLVVVGDVVAAVTQGRFEERQQPQAIHAQPLQVVQPFDEPPDVAGAVPRGVAEAADDDLVEDGVLVPVRIVAEHRCGGSSQVVGG